GRAAAEDSGPRGAGFLGGGPGNRHRKLPAGRRAVPRTGGRRRFFRQDPAGRADTPIEHPHGGKGDAPAAADVAVVSGAAGRGPRGRPRLSEAVVQPAQLPPPEGRLRVARLLPSCARRLPARPLPAPPRSPAPPP